MEAICSSETSVDNLLHGVISWKMVLFSVAVVPRSCFSEPGSPIVGSGSVSPAGCPVGGEEERYGKWEKMLHSEEMLPQRAVKKNWRREGLGFLSGAQWKF
jgi:hypothetical protein